LRKEALEASLAEREQEIARLQKLSQAARRDSAELKPTPQREDRTQVQDLRKKLEETQEQLDAKETEANDFAEKYVQILAKNRKLEARCTHLESKLAKPAAAAAAASSHSLPGNSSAPLAPSPAMSAKPAPAVASVPTAAAVAPAPAAAAPKTRTRANPAPAPATSAAVISAQKPLVLSSASGALLPENDPGTPKAVQKYVAGLTTPSFSSRQPLPTTPLKQLFSSLANPGGQGAQPAQQPGARK
jgi:hypothetical protein